MSSHLCTVEWQRGAQAFTDQQYSRAHRWRFDGGAEVPGSSSPHNVKVPLSDPTAVDPEEAFVAAVASCHMLWFLSLTAQRGFVLDSYADQAEGRMQAIGEGRKAMAEVVLRPQLVFTGARLPTDADIAELHHEAHRQCYIANSIRSEVRIEGGWRAA